jgi:TonB family protein
MRRGVILLVLSFAAASAQPRPFSHLTIRKPSPPPVAVKGVPYSGEFVSESKHELDDGTRIIESYVVRTEYRDSQGRTRREQVLPPATKESLRWVTIDDPAAAVEYVLEPAKKVAHRFTMKPSPLPQLSLGPPEVSVHGIATKSEVLGTQTIQGLRAEGVRQTLTIPDSSPLGDRGPRQVMTDTWTATDLQTVVYEHTVDLLFGNETNGRMTNLRREEQPASLFEVPPDYRMEDELEDFVIEYQAPGRTQPPEVISRVGANYTREAGRAGIQGTVVLAATVDETGKARDVHVERSLDPGLDQEAIKAVSRWRFRPGREDGHPVRVDVKVEVIFGLN